MIVTRDIGLNERRVNGLSDERHHAARAIGKEITLLAKDDAAWQTWFAAQSISPLQITCEGLASDPQSVLRLLLTAMDRNPSIARDVEPATSKMADDESRQWVERYRQEPR